MVEFRLYHKEGDERPFELRGGLPVLTEHTTYLVEGKNLQPVPGLINVVKHGAEDGEDLAELNFGNCVGNATIYGHGFLVTSSKVTKGGFDRMLREVTDEIANLPFDYNSPTFLPYARSSAEHRDVLYQRFAFLRQVVLFDRPNMEEQFHIIHSNPHRTMLRIACRSDLTSVRSFTGATILDAVSNPQEMARIYPGHPAYQLKIAFVPFGEPDYRLIPTTLLDERVEVTYDNIENRFLKRFLKDALLVAEQFGELIKLALQQNSYTGMAHDLVDEASRVASVLERLLEADFLDDVGELTRFPASSQVLQKSAGYREFLGHFHHLNLASEFPIDAGSLERILEGKDVATLYEYWCFFTVVAQLREMIGEPRHAEIIRFTDFKAELTYGIKIRFNDDTTLGYNIHFQKGSATGSYSVGLRPDISLDVNGQLHLLDAKFKYERIAFDTQQDLDETEREEEAFDRFKLGDLYKMHTYRDAIERAVSVWIVYPGTEFVFFEEGRGKHTDIDVIECISGVGAVPLKPIGETISIRRLLDRLLKDR